MSFIALKKNSSYHSRFQVKWRRRREGKTDYHSRKGLLYQDKRKYNSPKFRIVVRKTKKNFLVQFIQSKLEGDFILKSISPRLLKTYNIDYSLTSFPAAYTSGLLLAKIMMKEKICADKAIKSIIKNKTKNFNNMHCATINRITTLQSNGKSPPKAILDIGLSNVTTGNKLFATMKGAIDGGLAIPYNEKRFPGYNATDGFSPELLKERIVGDHITTYMNLLKDEDEERFYRQFSKTIKKKRADGSYSDPFLNANKIFAGDKFQ